MAPLHASGARPHYASIVDPLPTPSASSSGGASVFGLAAAAAALLGLCAVWAAAPSTAPAPQGLFQATAVRTAPASLAAVAPQWDRSGHARAVHTAPSAAHAAPADAATPQPQPAPGQSLSPVPLAWATALAGLLGAFVFAVRRAARPDIMSPLPALDLGQPPIIAMATVSGESAVATARPSAEDAVYDVRFVAENPDVVLAHLRARSSDSAAAEAAVARIGELYKNRSELTTKRDSALGQRKKLSGQIGGLMRGDGQSADPQKKKEALFMIGKLKASVEEANATAEEADKELSEQTEECDSLFAVLPNLLADRTPEGANEDENELVSEWGTDLRKIGDDYKWHDEIAEGLGGYWTEGATRVAGARFAVLSNDVARLERALAQYMLDTHVANGYQEMAVPYIVGRSVLEGTGQLPKFEDDLFKVSHQVNGQDGFLIPTAEVPLTNLYANTILEERQLPVSMCALTPCFRAEAGGYGRDTRGLIRQHQFQKVELVKITAPEDSQKEHELLTSHAENILQALKLPYRKMRLCAGDIGFSARECFDLEVWLPGQQMYREISSCSNCYDFQARRMRLRYKKPAPPPPKGKKPKKPSNVFAHTINGSGIAVGRALLAVLENYQQEDGSVLVPEVLQKYMDGKTVLTPADGN